MLQLLKDSAASGCRLFLPQPLQHPLQKSESPAPFEQLVGTQVVGGFESISFFGAQRVQRHQGAGPAAFLSAHLVPLVRKKPLEGQKQKGTKAAFGLVGRGEIILFDHTGEERLDQIFSVLGSSSEPPDESV